MIRFDEATHRYFDGDKELISVTTLMRKHGLSPDYAGVSSDVLQAKAERGSLIHKEIEEYNKRQEIGFTAELQQYIDYNAENNIAVTASEIIIHNDIAAGTCDLILKQAEQPIIADIKTTYALHKEAVRWQLSIYLFLYTKTADEYAQYNAQVYHFDKDGKLNVVDVSLKHYDEVVRLMECERKGELYKQEIAELNVDLEAVARLEAIIKYCDDQKKKAEEQAKEIKEALLKSMEKNDIKQYENDAIKITYVAPTTRTTIDSAKLKADLPDIAEKYSKTSNVKASIRITLKEIEQNDA